MADVDDVYDDVDVVEKINAATNHFQVLALQPEKTDAAIVKRAYYDMARLCHPDRSSHPEAQTAFQTLSTAYLTLVDEGEQEAYLRCLREGLSYQQASFTVAHMAEMNDDALIRCVEEMEQRCPTAENDKKLKWYKRIKKWWEEITYDPYV